MRRQPPHHLSPAKQTTRQGVIPKGASTAPQPAQQRSDQGRKPVISEQDSCSLAWIIALMRETEFLPRAGMAADSENKLPSLGKFFRDVTRPERRDLQKIPQPGEFNDLFSGQDSAN